MFNYSIIPLEIQEEYIDAMCQDIKQQYENGVASCALICIKLVPEGDPLIPKAEQQCEKYDLFRDKLNNMGVDCGVLVQCTLGHGYPLNSMPKLSRIKNLTDGQEVFSFCPGDQRFREYLRHSFQVIASHKPQHIMVDDDFRLIMRPGKGCACDLHLDAFARRTGVRKNREEIFAHCTGDSDTDKVYRDAFVETQLESLVECARYMREGIDSVDPTLPGSFCCEGPCCEAATQIATILAGKGNPVQVRVNNGRYHPVGPKELSRAFMRAAIQIATLKGQGYIDNFLAETDTCPQNRYSTGAMSLHAHFTGSILEGVSGAKHWITRMDSFEPQSGKKYREVLGKYKGFYDRLSKMVPTFRWRGARIPVSSVPDYSFNGDNSACGWSTCVLERLGLPFYFSDKATKVTFLDGTMDALYTDDQIMQMLSNTLIVDGACAERLCKRGFSNYLGVEVKPWHGRNMSGEVYLNEKIKGVAQTNAREITCLDETVIADSTCYHLNNGITEEPMFPATTVYKNVLGGTAIVFCGDAKTAYYYTTAFAFLNETRKKQLVRLLKQYGDLPIYVPDDDEVYLRVADMADGSLFCAVFNISLDPIESIRLVCEKTPKSVEYLTADGVFEACGFDLVDGVVELEKSAEILTPVVLKLGY